MDATAKIQQEVDLIAQELIGLSHTLYENPEIGFQEYKACQWLSEYLSSKGFEVERGAGGVETAFYAKMPHQNATPRIAFLAEYDALPKIGHGCGHNLIATASLGAGIALSRCLDGVTGSVVVVGTPAEEGGGGKIMLLNAGVLDQVSAAMMFHPSASTLVGDDALGRIKFTVEFFGKPAHASGCPSEGLNALDAIVLFFSSIGLLRQQLKGEARVHGIITHGGDAANIIPDYTAASMYVRAMNAAYLEDVLRKVQNCAQGAALSTGTQFKITLNPMRYEPMKRNHTLEQACQRRMEAMGLTIEQPDPTGLGSTDMANVSQKMPVIHPYIAICGKEVAGHSVELAQASVSPLADKALIQAAKILALTAYDYLTSPELRASVTQEFQHQ